MATELEAKKLQIFRSIDKLDRIGLLGVFDLLTEGRRDPSGDFTPGVGLSIRQAVYILNFLSSDKDTQEARNIKALFELQKRAAIYEDDYEIPSLDIIGHPVPLDEFLSELERMNVEG